ncbi:MAG: T9SS type A sorting domain-containing protein [Bacteroidota bacterium]
MNRSVKTFIIIALSLVGHPGIFAQEVVMPLFGNPHAAEHHRDNLHVKKSASVTLLDLPLFDDFSATAVVPDTGIWSDAYAFVNNNFCKDPVTNGVATLDALDSDGSIYTTAVLAPSTFVADHMTSHSIQLEYPASDSIYLSFLYQPGGLCDAPEEQDSLMVDFFAPDSGQWINVWSIAGSDLLPFRHAMIPVTNERFLTSGFKFRFRNRASLSRSNDYPDMRSNVDFWHVDYVRLDRNRFAADTVLRDVAFNTPLNSILKDLTSLPWSHFELAYNTVLDKSAFARYRNNDTITRNVTRSLTIHEPMYNETHTPEAPTAQDLPALNDTIVNFGYIYPLDFNRGDSAIIRFKAALRTDEFDPKVNDTVIYDQLFNDYYSYDDGTAEAGYGLRGGGTAEGVVAMKYHSYQPDQLGGVYIYFNHVYDSLNLNYYFNLVVWDDSEGQPGSVIWEDDNEYKPIYSSSYPGFIKYHFSQPVPVNGPFYVGWRQYKEYILNVGLDLNNRPASPVMFYNLQGIWESSAAPGVMMFRPFLYNETSGLPGNSAESSSLHIYPNPATDVIYFELPVSPNGERIQLEIFDASGRLAERTITDSNSMNISSLPAGIYYIRALVGRSVYHSKLLINP